MQIRKTIPNDAKELARLIKELETTDDYLSETQQKIRAFSNLDKAAEKAAERYISQPGYLSFVADENGSKQSGLWGGGLDMETKEIDYNSIINLRPGQNNPSRDILSQTIREKFDQIVQNLLL